MANTPVHIELEQIVQLKKKHPCGGDLWKIVRVGADVKITCLTCQRTVMLDRAEFIKRIKKVEPCKP
jgi:hypothetical protein